MIIPTKIKIKGSLICLFFVLVFTGCKKPIQQSKLAGNALGTTYYITYVGADNQLLEADIDSIHAEFNQALSTYDSSSFISLFNRDDIEGLRQLITNDHDGSLITHFATMLEQSKNIYKATNGAFDPSAEKLFTLYLKAKKEKVMMDSLEVDSALNFKGLLDVRQELASVPQKFRDGITLNFNAIAKGYFVDVLALYMESLGIENYMVEVGGEVRARGKNASGENWTIGINTPVEGHEFKEIFEALPLDNESMATSGNYQDYYYVNGQIVGHTFDPRTGKPVISDLKSATVMHKQCAVADAYATACMVMGREEAIQLIKSDKSLSAYFIYEEMGQLKGIRID